MSSENKQLVKIYTTNNQAMIAMVKSLLDDAGIPYSVSGDMIQGVWPLFQWAEFSVKAENEGEARELLKDV